MKKYLLLVLALFYVNVFNAYAIEKEDIPHLAGLGVLVYDGPYKGRDTQVAPAPIICWENDRFFVRELKGGVILYETEEVEFDAFLKPRLSGYDNEDSNDLDGMDDRDYSLDGGLQFTWDIPVMGNLELGTSVAGDLLSEYKGMEIESTLSKLFDFTPVFVRLGIGVSWQSESLVDYYYGVKSTEVTATRSEYSPNSAVNGNIALDVYLALSEEWLVVSRVKCDFLNNEIKDSPIVDEDYTITTLLGVTRMF